MKRLLLLFYLLFIFDGQALAKNQDISRSDEVKNFTVVYGSQWIFYYYSQKNIIKKNGSFNNWLNNPYRLQFDKDHFDYNVVKHPIAGSYYYLWYRSRGYSEKKSFIWTTMSSLAFEFTIETVTERPSIQDIFQTPLFGSALGHGLEKAAQFLHSLNTWYGHALGYALNPFTLFPTSHSKQAVNFSPLLNRERIGAIASYQF